MKKSWIEYAKKADFNAWAEELHISPLTARILRNRDILTISDARKYLYGSMDDLGNLHDIKDMDRAVSILVEALAKKEKVCIASDYDVDGIFASQILREGLEKVGFLTFVTSPNRVDEGYGINRRIIEEAKDKDCAVILTCDNGIAAKEELAYAKELGFEVIVTDHHEAQFETLPADAVVDLKNGPSDYAFKELCGAGIAFRLIQALYEELGLPKETEETLYEYVAIATVADVVPLLDENRILVKTGLERLKKTTKPGLRALMDVQSLVPENISAYSIGYVLGPCFNAVSRLTGEADLSRDLLNAKAYEEALPLAEKMAEMNNLRKEMTEEGYEEAIAMIEEASWKNDSIYVVDLENANESVIGIIAGRLKEKFARPVLVLTKGKEEKMPDGTALHLMKGSGRSIEAYDLMNGLMQVKDLLYKFGGHKMACGLTILSENVEIFRKMLNEQCTLTKKELTPVLSIDGRVPFAYMTKSLVRELKVLEPFGAANESPVFARPHLTLESFRILGKNQNVVKMSLKDENGNRLDGIQFGDATEFVDFLKSHYGEETVQTLQYNRSAGVDIALAFYPDINEYQGAESIQLHIQDYCII